MKDQSEFLTTGLEAVKAAEEVILRYLKDGFTTEFKQDLSPVTIADKEAEHVIKQVISEHFPEHTFHGEEGEKEDLSNHHGYSWVIDPIDGTKNFMRGNPNFATLLALMHNGELILGISNMPLMNELMYAEKGAGSYLNGERVHVSDISKLDEAYLSHGSLKYFMRTNTIDQLLEISTEVRQTRGFADAWSYHLLAQGKLEVMIEPYCRLWDIAPAKVIIEEAGGRFTQLDGQPISPDSTTALATNGKLHDTLLAKFRPGV